MTVTVSLPFVTGCSACAKAAMECFAAALGDPQVTSFTGKPGKAHNHPDGPTEVTVARLEANGQQRLPVSDTNGSAPEDVEAALNGFDPKGREA